MIIANILAGGSGSRMGNTSKPKQFLTLKDKPIIVHTAMRFLFHKEFKYVVIATPKAYVAETKKLFEKHLNKTQLSRIVICTGGTDRNGSIINSIKAAQKKLNKKDFSIVTHDAARPFVAHTTIKDNITLASKYDVIDTVIGSTDTIVISNKGKTIDSIPSRKSMYQGQTPQTFKAEAFLKLIKNSTKEQLDTFTDACGLFIANGVKVALAKGTTSNIKITTPYDLRLANAIIEVDKYDK